MCLRDSPSLNSILDECDKLGVPVFIDFAYMVMAREVTFDLNRECIEGVAFSLSKGFYGTEKLRVGMRCKKKYSDDPIDVFNSLGQIGILGAIVGLEICRNFEPDYIQKKYRQKQLDVCSVHNLQPTNCVTFGLASSADDYSAQGQLWKWTIDTTNGKVSEEQIDDKSVDFGRVDDRLVGLPARFGLSLIHI